MPFVAFSFMVGALVAGVGVFYYMAHDSTDSFMMFALGDSAKAYDRTMQAYQHEDPDIAIWELRHLADLQVDHLESGLDGPRSLQFQLFITHGRLARLYQEQGDMDEAKKYSDVAIGYHLQFSPTNQFVTNMTSLLDWIQQLDEREKKQPRYE